MFVITEFVITEFDCIWKQTQSPHVASGEWVGQREGWDSAENPSGTVLAKPSAVVDESQLLKVVC